MQRVYVGITGRKVVRDSVTGCLIFLDIVADSGGGGAKIALCGGGVVRSSKTCAAFFQYVFGIKFDKFLHLYFLAYFSQIIFPNIFP